MAILSRCLVKESQLGTRTIETLQEIHEAKQEELSDASAERFMLLLFQLCLVGKALDALEEKTEEEQRHLRARAPSYFGWVQKVEAVGNMYIIENLTEREGLFEEVNLTVDAPGILAYIDATVEAKIRELNILPEHLTQAVLDNMISFLGRPEESIAA